jgi:hypothetical protein
MLLVFILLLSVGIMSEPDTVLVTPYPALTSNVLHEQEHLVADSDITLFNWQRQSPAMKVRLADGTVKPFSDVAIGDQLMGWDSTPRLVVKSESVTGRHFLLTPAKGDCLLVHEDNLLVLRTRGERDVWRYHDCRRGNLFFISPSVLLNQATSLQKYARIVRKGVDYLPREVVIEPYWLGVWLGDGNSRNTGITSMDAEVVEAVFSEANRRSLKVRADQTGKSKAKSYFIHGGTRGKWGCKNSLLRDLRSEGLICNKHIPDKYKFNSEEVRLQVIAGLLDTDGCLSNGYFIFSNKSDRLALDFAEVVRSLDMACYISNQYSKLRGGFYHSWAVHLSGDCRRIPTRIPRKQCNRVPAQDVSRVGFVLQKSPIKQSVRVVTDGDGMYILDDFTVWTGEVAGGMFQ